MQCLNYCLVPLRASLRRLYQQDRLMQLKTDLETHLFSPWQKILVPCCTHHPLLHLFRLSHSILRRTGSCVAPLVGCLSLLALLHRAFVPLFFSPRLHFSLTSSLKSLHAANCCAVGDLSTRGSSRREVPSLPTSCRLRPA